MDLLTRTVLAALNGSLFVWAMLREGTAAQSVRADVDAVLAPYLETGAGSAHRGHPAGPVRG